jgi:hypothetical protein
VDPPVPTRATGGIIETTKAGSSNYALTIN